MTDMRYFYEYNAVILHETFTLLQYLNTPGVLSKRAKYGFRDQRKNQSNQQQQRSTSLAHYGHPEKKSNMCDFLDENEILSIIDLMKLHLRF